MFQFRESQKIPEKAEGRFPSKKFSKLQKVTKTVCLCHNSIAIDIDERLITTLAKISELPLMFISNIPLKQF